MAKPLRHTKAGTTEVQRLLCHHIDQALKTLQGNQPLSDAAVHSVQKQLKKGRADLRLLRKALGFQRYAYENTVLRDVARPLTAVRDARTFMDTLDRLVEHGGVQTQALALDRVRQALRDEYGEVRQRILDEGNTLEILEASLRAARARAQRWPSSNSRLALIFLYELCRKVLSEPSCAPFVVFDTICTARIEARHDSLPLLASTWVELRHG